MGTWFIARENQLGDPDNDIGLSNGGALATAGTLPFGSIVTLPASRSITLSRGGRLGSNGSEQLRIEGVISGTGPLQIMTGGLGVMLAGENTFSGSIEVADNARLTVLGDAALGQSGNQLVMVGTSLGAGLTLAGSGVTLPASRTIRIDAGRKASFGATGTDATVAGNIMGGGAVSTFGQGVLHLTGNNVLSRLEVGINSTLAVGKDVALGSPGGTLVLTSGTLLATDSFVVPATRKVLSTFTSGVNRIDTGAHTLTINGVIAPNLDNDTEGGAIQKLGTGRLVLNGVNTVQRPIDVLAGEVMGDGSVRVLRLFNEALLSPGQPGAAGLFTVGQVLTLGGLTTMLFQLGGLARGVCYDALNVTGVLARGGVVDVRLIGGFVPATGSSFDLIDFGTATGSFAELRLPPLPTGLEWQTSAFATTGVISVIGEVAPEFVRGDFNSDGGFDGSDVDGFVEALSGGRPGAVVIPEPGSLGLLAAAGLMLRRRRG